MSTSFIRWTGLFAVFAGVSLILQQLYDLVAPDPTNGLWIGLHILGYLGLSFGLLGQVGIASRQWEKFGRLGQTGFLLGFIGNGVTIGAAFLNTFIVPVATTQAPSLIAPTGPLFTGPLGLIVLLASLLVTLGFILFGIATARAGVLPAIPAWIVVVTAWFGIAAVFARPVFDVTGALFGLGNAWLGWSVWSKTE